MKEEFPLSILCYVKIECAKFESLVLPISSAAKNQTFPFKIIFPKAKLMTVQRNAELINDNHLESEFVSE